MERRYILLKIAYDGTNFGGFQVQKNAPSVQKTLQQAIEQVTGETVTLTGCGRTDAGVHASEYFALTSFVCAIPLDHLPQALAAKLPDTVSVKGAYLVEKGFHPRYAAHSKIYRYTLLNSKTDDPFLHRTTAHFTAKLDTDAMNQAAKKFVGSHDFRAFMASGSKIEDTVRTVYSCAVARHGDIVDIEIGGNGFLYNMVRIIAGTLCDVGTGKKKPDEIPAVIASRDRNNAGKTMPAKGLMLIRVNYGEEHCFD